MRGNPWPELVIVKADSVWVQDYDGNATAELDLSDIGRTYPYYAKEIDEQPTVMRKLIQAYTDEDLIK